MLVYGGNVVGVVFAAVTIAVGPAFGSFESSALSTIAEPFVSHSSAARTRSTLQCTAAGVGRRRAPAGSISERDLRRRIQDEVSYTP